MGGAVAQSAQTQVVLSLDRMQCIRNVDIENDSITVDAGCILADVQAAAEQAGRLFPLSLAAEGSCRIGGNLATNAGGVNVLRYGNIRDLCLGLEVVLANGEVWQGLSGLRKDNSGYDLKQLFIGSEGSLGVITAATLKLFPRNQQSETAWLALPDPKAAITLLNKLRHATGDNLIACELIPQLAVDLVSRHIDGCRNPCDAEHPWHLLIEAATPARGEWLRASLFDAIEQAMHDELIRDGLLADNLGQAQAFWRIRENIPEAQVREGASIKHDVSVVVSRIPDFLQRAGAAVTRAVPGVRICAFGHVGDGNLHFNLSQPENESGATFMARTAELNQIVHDIVVDMHGSFAAEHGVGRLKTNALQRYKSAQALTLMQTLKKAIDPHAIMNPGAVVAASSVTHTEDRGHE